MDYHVIARDPDLEMVLVLKTTITSVPKIMAFSSSPTILGPDVPGECD